MGLLNRHGQRPLSVAAGLGLAQSTSAAAKQTEEINFRSGLEVTQHEPVSAIKAL